MYISVLILCSLINKNSIKFIKFETKEYIKKSYLFLFISSLSINIAILLKKNIIICSTSFLRFLVKKQFQSLQVLLKRTEKINLNIKNIILNLYQK